MKINYSVPPPEFRPITSTITVESLGEYRELEALTLLNLSSSYNWAQSDLRHLLGGAMDRLAMAK